jgi:aminopeptidase N
MKKILLFSACLPLLGQAQHLCSASKISAPQGTQASAKLRDLENKYDLKFYHLNIAIERSNKYISGNVRCLAAVKASTLDTFAFELHSNFTIDSVVLNGSNRPVTRSGNDVYVTFAGALAQGAMIDGTVYYKGTAPTSGGGAIGDGYNQGNSPTWGNSVAWSLSQPYVAHEWFPVKQQLQDKIDSSWVFATTDSLNKVGSNGMLTNVVTVGPKKRYEWKNNKPIDYYLISVAVAKYVDYTIYAHPASTSDSVMIQNYVYDNPATLPYFKDVIDSTRQLIELQSSLYGLYPWASQKYGHCMAPLGGGMEHQTMTTLGSFNFSLVAHELGHQWWGDYVTCRTWHDIFLNEGFATYTEYLAYQYLEPGQAAPEMLSIHNNVMSQPTGSVWNPDTTNVNRIFSSRLSYNKGCAIVHSIRFEMNDDSLFFPALRNYLNTYKYTTASTEDFRNSIASFTGINFNQFFTQWIYGEGYPTFNVSWNQNNGQLVLKSVQTVSTASVTPLFITPLEYKVQRNLGDTIIRVMHSQATELYVVNMPGTVTGIVVDPNNWILNKVIGPVQDPSLVGIESTNYDPEIRVYPNPAHGQLSIKGNGDLTFRLYDLTGKQVESKAIRQQGTLNLEGYAAGLYIYKVTDAEQRLVKTGKLVLQ